MLYSFRNTDSNEKSTLDLPNCTIIANNKKYVIKDSVIQLFELNNDGEITGDCKIVNDIQLSDEHVSIFTQLASMDNYKSRIDTNDLNDLSKKDLKSELKETYGEDKDIKFRKVKIRDYSFRYRVKNKETGEIDYLSFIENRESLITRIWKKIKPKKKIKYKTPEFQYQIDNHETLETIALKFNVTEEELIKKNPDLIDNPKLNSGSKIIIPGIKHKTKVLADNVQKIPEHEYIVEEGMENPATLANLIGISQYRLLESNPHLKTTNRRGETIIRALEPGEAVKIPEYEVVTKLNKSSLEGISEQIGISKAYIEDILFSIEGRHSKPDLKPYYDGVKDRLHPKGYLTIGFGHTGRVFGIEMNSKNKDYIKITEDEAYLILAQDLMIAKQDAQYYFGEDFDKAPLSVQEAIIDIIFNKGIEGLQREDSPCLNLKNNLKNKDYASAAANAIVDPTIRGLMKRNVYRVIMATRDLKPKKRALALEKAREYYEKTLNKFAKDSLTSRLLEQHWQNAQEGIVTGFFK